MTPWATVILTGWAGATPVVPNAGDAVTAATGPGDGRGGVVVVDDVPVSELPPDDGAACESPGSGGASSEPTVAGEVEVDDSPPVPQPATAVRTTVAVTTSARHRIRCASFVPITSSPHRFPH